LEKEIEMKKIEIDATTSLSACQTIVVATLAVGSQRRQGLARLQTKRES
jgi:ABC-type transport system involved in cytochrome c biogenesis ATPase subunit